MSEQVRGIVTGIDDEPHVEGRRLTVRRVGAVAEKRGLNRDATTFERLFDDDYFAEHPDWADDLPDLGRERLPPRDADEGRGVRDE